MVMRATSISGDTDPCTAKDSHACFFLLRDQHYYYCAVVVKRVRECKTIRKPSDLKNSHPGSTGTRDPSR